MHQELTGAVPNAPTAWIGEDDDVMIVIGLGAWCDLVTEDDYRAQFAEVSPSTPGASPAPGVFPSGMSRDAAAAAVEEAMAAFRRSANFSVQEFANLSDGRRVTLHSERGFGLSGIRPAGLDDPFDHLSLTGLEADVRNTVLPDEDGTGDAHPYEWLAQLLHAHGVPATADQLRPLPYVVEFSPRLRARWTRPD